MTPIERHAYTYTLTHTYNYREKNKEKVRMRKRERNKYIIGLFENTRVYIYIKERKK
jgi:hypothetical protein